MLTAELSAVIREYSHIGPLQSPPERQVGGFSGAHVWKIRLRDDFYCLRRWPPDGIERTRLEALHALMEGIHLHGVTELPMPFRRPNGSSFVELRGALWHLESWKPGRADFCKCRSEARLRNTMQVMARCHRAALATCPTLPKTAHFFQSSHSVAPAIAARLSLMQGWTTTRQEEAGRAIAQASQSPFHVAAAAMLRHFRRLAPQSTTQLLWAQQLRVPIQPCLRDVWHDHVLFTGDRVTGLIDCGAARTDTVACDLSRLLGSFVGNDTGAWNLALSEYVKHNPLTAGEMQLVPILDRSGLLLSGMTWIDRHLLRGLPLENPLAVTARLEQIVNRLDPL